MYLRWIASLVNYILVAIFLWCNVSSLHCIFGVMYMHFWYAMHRQLCWCLVGVITIVQCIFGALFLGLGCNIFLVLRLWCYALSAISRRLATAVAHLLYLVLSVLTRCFETKSKYSLTLVLLTNTQNNRSTRNSLALACQIVVHLVPAWQLKGDWESHVLAKKNYIYKVRGALK